MKYCFIKPGIIWYEHCSINFCKEFSGEIKYNIIDPENLQEQTKKIIYKSEHLNYTVYELISIKRGTKNAKDLKAILMLPSDIPKDCKLVFNKQPISPRELSINSNCFSMFLEQDNKIITSNIQTITKEKILRPELFTLPNSNHMLMLPAKPGLANIHGGLLQLEKNSEQRDLTKINKNYFAILIDFSKSSILKKIK